jgi:hypothetical protein
MVKYPNNFVRFNSFMEEKMDWKKIFCFIAASFLYLNCSSDGGSTLPEDTKTGTDTDAGQKTCVDNDGDGYGYNCPKGTDCDDSNPKVHENCLQCQDKDGDGYGIGKDCLGSDCNDNDPMVNPKMKEICGNGKDDDCKGDGDAQCVKECTDNDNDGYGTGKDCKGPDCDDKDFMVHPGMPEQCGNGKDDDCKDGDLVCPANCTDKDKDNYGTGADCLGPDCDDDDPKINPKAVEICDSKDNDCDDKTDECAEASQECDLEAKACKTKLSYSCKSTTDCISGLVCYSYKCLQTEGGPCLTNQECQTNLCDKTSKTCVGNICEILKCEDNNQKCDSKKGKCIECEKGEDCPDWYYDACAGGKCKEVVSLAVNDDTKKEDITQGMVNCHKMCEPGGKLCFCYFIDTLSILKTILGKDEVLDWICNDAKASDFDGGESDLSIAKDLGGCGGFFDWVNIVWKTGITPDSYDFVDCMFWSPSDVWIDKCMNYPGD